MGEVYKEKLEKRYMELKELIGLHTLTGVTNENKKLQSAWDEDETYDAQAFTFILDGVIYTAIEDNNDGYRSAMDELKVNEFVCNNIFEPIQVLGIYIDKSGGYDEADLLHLYGMNGKLLLEVGTSNSDDYYPSFVSSWHPDNI